MEIYPKEGRYKEIEVLGEKGERLYILSLGREFMVVFPGEGKELKISPISWGARVGVFIDDKKKEEKNEHND